MSNRPTRTDLATVRDALAMMATDGPIAAGRKYSVSHKSLYRWARQREEYGPQWPTDADIQAWRDDQAANAQRRQARRTKEHDYRKRRYVNRGPVLIDSTGTARRLQALLALGHRQQDLGAELGVCIQRVHALVRQRRPLVHPDTAAAVRVLYDRLSMTVPQDGPRPWGKGYKSHEAARKRARGMGYVVPLAWDEGRMDDPAYHPYQRRRPLPKGQRRPRVYVTKRDQVDEAVVLRALSGERLEMTPAERTEVARRWLASGRSSRELCRIQGWREGRYTGREDVA